MASRSRRQWSAGPGSLGPQGFSFPRCSQVSRCDQAHLGSIDTPASLLLHQPHIQQSTPHKVAAVAGHTSGRLRGLSSHSRCHCRNKSSQMRHTCGCRTQCSCTGGQAWCVGLSSVELQCIVTMHAQNQRTTKVDCTPRWIGNTLGSGLPLATVG